MAEFDPDAYLKKYAPKQESSFDPNAYLAKYGPSTTQGSASTSPAAQEPAPAPESVERPADISAPLPSDETQKPAIDVATIPPLKNAPATKEFDQYMRPADPTMGGKAPGIAVTEEGMFDNPSVNWDDPAQLKRAMETPIVHDLPRPSGQTVAAGVVRGLEAAGEGLTSRTNIALMLGMGSAPAVIQKIAALGFGTMMAREIPAKIIEGQKAAAEGKTGDAAEQWTGAAVDTLMAALSFGHAGGRLEGSPAVDKAKQTLRAQGLSQEQVDAVFKRLEIDGPASLRNASEATIDALVKDRALRKASGFPENVIEAEVARRAAMHVGPIEPAASTPTAPAAEPSPSETPQVPSVETVSPPNDGGKPNLFQQLKAKEAAEALAKAADAAKDVAPASAEANAAPAEELKAKAVEQENVPRGAISPVPAEASPVEPSRSQETPVAESAPPANAEIDEINRQLYENQTPNGIAGTPAALGDAVNHLAEIAGSGDSLSEGTPADAEAEKAALIQWAADNNLLVAPIDKIPSTSGSEHEVYFMDQGNRVVKVTRPGTYGAAPKLGELHSDASPVEYLRRLQNANEILGDDIRLHGVTPNGEIVTSQPAITGEPLSHEEIASAMEDNGFVPSKYDSEGDYFRSSDGTLILDLHPENALKKDGVMYPFDVTVIKPTGKFLEEVKSQFPEGPTEKVTAGELTPAIRTPEDILTGDDHPSIIETHGLDPVVRESDDAGFLDEKGNFISRAEAADRLKAEGIETAKPDEAHTSDLPDYLEKTLGDIEKALGEEEPPVKRAAEMTKEEKLARLNEELQAARDAGNTRAAKDVRARIKALEKEPQAESKEPAKAEPEAPKEPWQKTRAQITAEGGSLAKHRLDVRAAVKAGKPVPLEVLEGFGGSDWADKAIEKNYGGVASPSLLDDVLKAIDDDPTKLYSDPLLLNAAFQHIGKPLIRGAVAAIRASLEAGALAKDAIEDGIRYLQKNSPDWTAEKEKIARALFEKPKGGDSVEKGNEEKEGQKQGVLIPPGEGDEVPSPSPATTALKKAVVNEQRQARGGKEIPIPSPALNEQQMVDDARARIASDPTLAQQLVSRIVDEKDTRISEEDAATILAERRRVINERNRWEDVAGNKDSTEAQKSQARIALGGIEDHLDRLDQASRAAGSTWSRIGRMYQVDLREDFTRDAMERKLRAAKGRPLNRQESEAIAAASKRIEKLEEQLSEASEMQRERDEAFAVIQTLEATIADLKKEKEPEKPSKESKPLSESIVTYARSVRDAALARIKERKGKMFADPIGVMSAIDLADHAIVGATHIIEGAVTFGKWSTEMVKDFGESIRPHLKLIYDAAKDQAKKIEREASKPKEKTRIQAKAAVKAKATAGEPLSHKAVYDLARAHINAGVHGEDAVIKAIHADIKESYPEATERDVRRAFSEYGKVKFPSKDAVDTELRELRRLAKLQEDIDRETTGLDALHSGLQRDKPTQAIRDKIKKLNELLKKRERPTSPERIAGREQAKQTALENAIADIDRELRTGESAPERAKTTDSPRTETLRAELAAMREKLAEIKAAENPPKTPAEKQVEQLGKVRQRLDDILSGKLDPAKPADRALLSREAENIQGEIDAMRELHAQMKRDAKPASDPGAKAEQAKIKALEKAIDAYSKKTAARDFTTAGVKLGPDSARVAALKEIRDSRRAMYEAVRDLGKTVKTPDEIYNERRMKEVQKQLATVRDRIANKDFAPKPKPPERNKNAAVRKAEEELKKEKSKFRLGVMEAERANRTAFQKFSGAVANLNRMNVLGHVSVLEHLAGAAVENLVTRPIGTGLAQIMRANKTLDAVRRKAVYEGHTGGEFAGLHATMHAWKSMVQKLTTGKSQLDWLHDAKEYPKEFGEIVSNVHAFIKEPIRQGIYARSMELRTKAAEAMGLDPAHDEVLAKALSNEAYIDANRDIFMGDNFLTKAIHNNVGSYLRGVKEDPGLARFTADVLDILFPVVNVSTNIAIRKARLAIGLGEAAIRLASAAKKGELANDAEKLSNEDAEKITRALKYGAFGLAIGAYAWTHANQFGGVFVPGDNAPRDKKTGLATGEIALPGGHRLSHHITHGPVGGYMNLVADARRLYDEKVKGNRASPWDAGGEAAAFAAMAGITDLPAFATVGRLTSPFKSAGQKVGEIIRNMLIFGAVQDAAEHFDKDSSGQPVKRSPETIVEEVEMGIPIIRKRVGLKATRHKK